MDRLPFCSVPHPLFPPPSYPPLHKHPALPLLLRNDFADKCKMSSSTLLVLVLPLPLVPFCFNLVLCHLNLLVKKWFKKSAEIKLCTAHKLSSFPYFKVSVNIILLFFYYNSVQCYHRDPSWQYTNYSPACLEVWRHFGTWNLHHFSRASFVSLSVRGAPSTAKLESFDSDDNTVSRITVVIRAVQQKTCHHT